MGFLPLDFTKLPVSRANDRTQVLAGLAACFLAYCGHNFAKFATSWFSLPCSFNELLVLWLAAMVVSFMTWRQRRQRDYKI
jgi:hypothetical protein